MSFRFANAKNKRDKFFRRKPVAIWNNFLIITAFYPTLENWWANHLLINICIINTNEPIRTTSVFCSVIIRILYSDDNDDDSDDDVFIRNLLSFRHHFYSFLDTKITFFTMAEWGKYHSNIQIGFLLLKLDN